VTAGTHRLALTGIRPRYNCPVTDLLDTIHVILVTYAFVPNELMSRIWTRRHVRAHPTDPIQVLYVHRYDLPTVRLTLWEGTAATRMTPLGTFAVTTDTEFINLLATCGWLN